MALVRQMTEIIYFAHSMRDYGTQRAREAREAIERLFPLAWVYDPEEIHWNYLQTKLGSCEAVYDYVVSRSSRVIVLEHQNHVGRGAFEEVSLALSKPIPVGVLREGKIKEVKEVALVDPNDWKIRYGRIIK